MAVVRPSVYFRTVFAPFLNASRRETGHSAPFGLTGGCAMMVFPFCLISCSHARLGDWLIVHEKLPQNLNPGFLSMIFTFRTKKTDEDVSMTWDLVRRMTWQDDVSMYGGVVAETRWQ